MCVILNTPPPPPSLYELQLLFFCVQGMSLDCVEISLERVFECGQAYVALSRARSMEGLRVLFFNAQCAKADRQVLTYYKQLQVHRGLKPRDLNLMSNH